MLLLQSVIASADPSDLETLDLILTRAGGIRAMIANPTARQEYFEALGRFGIKINLTSYDALLTSVTEAMDAFPGMEARLMQTEGLGTKLVLEIGSKSYGVTLKPKEFYEGYRNWIESLTEGFSLSRDDAILRHVFL